MCRVPIDLAMICDTSKSIGMEFIGGQGRGSGVGVGIRGSVLGGRVH